VITLIYFARLERYKRAIVEAGGIDFLSELIRQVRGIAFALRVQIKQGLFEIDCKSLTRLLSWSLNIPYRISARFHSKHPNQKVRSANGVEILHKIERSALELVKEIGAGACSRVWLARWNGKQVRLHPYLCPQQQSDIYSYK
jgi:hypothetical protein